VLTPTFSAFRMMICCLACCVTASAEVKTFAIDSGPSRLSIVEGRVAGIAAVTQGEGSRTTTFFGNIVADISEGFISFPGGSTITANENGRWAPDVGGSPGLAPANYGVQTSMSPFSAPNPTALRNLLFDLAAEPITLSGGAFAADTLRFGFPENSTATADYTWTVPFQSGRGTGRFSGTSINRAGLVAGLAIVGDELVLTIPVNFSITSPVSDFPFEDFRSATFQIQGQLTARSTTGVTLPTVILATRFVAGGLEIEFTPAPTKAALIETASSLPPQWVSYREVAAGATSVLIEKAHLPASPAFFRLVAKP